MRSFVPQAAPDQERMNARTEGFELSLQLHRREQNINAHISPAPFSAADVQITDRLQMVAFCVLAELVCEALWGQWVFCVVLTPPLIGCVQIFGAGFIIGLECHITLRIEKVQNVIGIPNSGRDIVLGSLADGKVVVIGDQPPQPSSIQRKIPSFSAISFSARNGSSNRSAGLSLVIRMIWRRKKPSLRSCSAVNAPLPKQRKRT